MNEKHHLLLASFCLLVTILLINPLVAAPAPKQAGEDYRILPIKGELAVNIFLFDFDLNFLRREAFKTS